MAPINTLTGSTYGVQTATQIPGMMSPLDTGTSGDDVTVTGGIGSSGSGQFGSGTYDFSSFADPTLTSFGAPDIQTPSFNFGTGSSSGGNLLQSAIGTLTGGGGLGSIAAIGGEAAAAAYGLSEAKKAQQQSQAQAQQIISATQPFLAASQQQLAQFQSGKLTPQQQQYVDFATKEGTDVINSGKGLQTIAQQQLGQFASGSLLPADQLQLDRNTSAAKQQIAQKMASSGTADSSIQAGYDQQIDQAAQIQKQQMLNQYFQTGNAAYNSWLTSTQQGAALMKSGADFAQQSFQEMMQNSLGLAGVGMSGLTTAIGLEIQSDTELSKSVSDLMASLASAFAYTVAGGAGVGGGGGAGGGGVAGGAGGGLLGSLISRGVNTAVNSGIQSLLGGSAAGGAAGGAIQAIGVDNIGISSDVASSLADFPSAAGGGAAAGGAGVGAAGAAGAGGAALAGGAGAVGSTAASIGAGAPGVFASGSAGAGSAAGAGAGVGALGAAATGIGAIAALPTVTQAMTNIGGKVFDALGMGGPNNVSVAPLMNNPASGFKRSMSGGKTGGTSFGQQNVQDTWNGKPVNLSNDDRLQAISLLNSGDMTAYNNFMKKHIVSNTNTPNAAGKNG